MLVKRYEMGPLATNTYFIFNNEEALVIDPAGKASKVIELLEGKKLIGILLTHGHFDHIKAVDELTDVYHCPVFLHESDKKMAHDKLQGHKFGIYNFITCDTIDLEEKEYELGSFKFNVLFTPGHTEGSVIYSFGNSLFTGDTLFKGSVGRTDLDGGDARKLKESLRIFKDFPKDTIVYPGHDEITSIEEELNNNPFLKM